MDGAVPSKVWDSPRAGVRLAGPAGAVGDVGGVTVGLEGLSDTQAALVRLLAMAESIRTAEERLGSW